MKTACIYHSIDLDGWMSAAIVKHWFATEHKEQEINIIDYSRFNDLDIKTINPSNLIVFIGYNYGQPIPDLSEYGKVIMCDISFPATTMSALNIDKTKELIWIDHHISAINDSINPPDDLLRFDKYRSKVTISYNNVSGLRDTKYSACELTWKYFFPNDEMPEIVRLLGRYDCFGHKGTDEEQKVLEFQYGARQCISNYEEAYSYLKSDIVFNSWDTIHTFGKYIYKYLCTEAKQIYNNGFSIEFDNPKWDTIEHYPNMPTKLKFICINKERFNPINFGIDYHKDGYDGCACFHFDGTHWNFSLYNDNGEIDCSQIAKRFGGGGHTGAAGFRLPFKNNNIDSFIRARIVK